MFLLKIRWSYFLFISISTLLFSCNEQRVYEENIDIEKADWKKQDTLSYEFDIQNPDEAYDLYYTVRYSNNYPFYNLFTKYWLYDSSGTLVKTPTLPEDMYLFDVKTGEPYGSGLGDLYDQKVNFLKDYKFPVKGTYKIKVVQYMRNEPLPGIASFGIVVEKAENKTE